MPKFNTVSFIYLINVFIFLRLAALRLRCCAQAFSSLGERGLLFFAVRGLLIAEHGLEARRLQKLWLVGSRAQAQ